MMIFGGVFSSSMFDDQISVVSNCGLERVGTMPTKFDRGACNTFHSNNIEYALLCFGMMNSGLKSCHR